MPLENTQQLLGQHGALALFGYNSATNSVDSLPLAARSKTLFFAPFSGSLVLRDHPNVFTIRASYREETLKIIESMRGVGAERAVILHYDDEVGRNNYEAVAGAYTEAGAPKPPGVAVKRVRACRCGIDRRLAEEPEPLRPRDHAVQRRRATC